MENQFAEVVRLRDVWPQFERTIPTDAAAADAIFQALEGQGGIVCRCSSTNVVRAPGSRTFRCLQCKHETWFTAKTLLERTTNLRGWLAAIYLKQNRVVVSPSQLARLTDISPTGAYEIQAKLNLVLCGEIKDDAMLLQSELFRSAICKRSRETPARLHPVDEELSAVAVAEGLGHCPRPLDVVCAPSSSEIAGTIDGELVLVEECLDVFVSPEQLPYRLIGSAIGFIKMYCHGISRKYLQLYLAGFCYQFQNSMRAPDALLTACLAHPPITYDDLMNYVTPLKVRFPLLNLSLNAQAIGPRP